MEHKGTVRLESERLILRRFEITDAREMFNNWATDDRTLKYLRWSAHESVMAPAEIISGIISLYDNPMTYIWVIALKDENTVLGSINLHSINDRNERSGDPQDIG